MNAKDIVEMLREYLQSSAPDQLGSEFVDAVWDATSLIESQTAVIAELEQQLSDSQRREHAAVEDLKASKECLCCKNNGTSLCKSCDVFASNFEWRGPQNAGKGETE